jgi:hypothetical protein
MRTVGKRGERNEKRRDAAGLATGRIAKRPRTFIFQCSPTAPLSGHPSWPGIARSFAGKRVAVGACSAGVTGLATCQRLSLILAIWRILLQYNSFSNQRDFTRTATRKSVGRGFEPRPPHSFSLVRGHSLLASGRRKADLPAFYRRHGASCQAAAGMRCAQAVCSL